MGYAKRENSAVHLGSPVYFLARDSAVGELSGLEHVRVAGSNSSFPATDGFTGGWRCCGERTSSQGFATTVRLLMFLGADAARGDEEKCTPLHWAALRGQGEVAALLVSTSASLALLEARESSQKTAAQLAVEKFHLEVAAVSFCPHPTPRTAVGGWFISAY